MTNLTLPDSYSTRVPTEADAGAVSELIASCQLAETGEAELTVE